jgi:hypothetical protein
VGRRANVDAGAIGALLVSIAAAIIAFAIQSREFLITVAGAALLLGILLQVRAWRGDQRPPVSVRLISGILLQVRAWRGGMKASDAKELRELRRQNATLKRIVADKELENVALKEIAKGNF